jgi:4a-hydroxytetrahydrobiopterin dehydratase
MNLAAEKCVPCVKGEGKLDIREAEDMLTDLDNWVIEGSHLVRRLKFKNFMAALDWVNRAGAIAEEQGHHPDITFGWGYVEIRLTTHDAGGLTRNDFILAAKLDGIR